MSTDEENWINEAMQTLGLRGRRVEELAAENLVARAESIFVSGSPRVWWLSLKFKPERWSNSETDLVRLSENPDDFGYFIPETDRPNLPVFRLTARESHAIIYDCPSFEYNFLDERLTTLIIENDHNEFLVVKAT